MVLGEVKRTFNPEFINRIEEIIVFEALETTICGASCGCWSTSSTRTW